MSFLGQFKFEVDANQAELKLLKVDSRIEESTGQKVGVESGIALGVFWLIILVTVVVYSSVQTPGFPVLRP
jgi:tetrahydromethanopterin S-methyltransferase subunit G